MAKAWRSKVKKLGDPVPKSIFSSAPILDEARSLKYKEHHGDLEVSQMGHTDPTPTGHCHQGSSPDSYLSRDQPNF